jgi:hypothetical protein
MCVCICVHIKYTYIAVYTGEVCDMPRKFESPRLKKRYNDLFDIFLVRSTTPTVRVDCKVYALN